jgi:tRNA threonylcarbamoyl adenosine modification protein YeaZ
MKILAIDFSSPQRSVAVLHGSVESEVLETNARQTDALGMIAEALRGAQLDREQIDCVAVGLGPGSYTGIRAAIALAQGWQLARAVKLAGISGAEVIAAEAQATDIRGTVRVVIDAQRGEFYLASFEITDANITEIAPLKIVSLETLRTLEQQEASWVGPEVTRWIAKGRIVFPRALTMARLAFRRPDFVSTDKLEPFYLRETTFVKAPPARIISDH